ncbi:MAG TPA: 7-carboxy-7-deazaguanine synthase QueE [Gammaproteobacteria bacterium]|nr:7-carboxy-7-deazaguanine synthase QueE [Gammaproteobacteria bacterium]MEC8010870.1 7-carboxy-7-deazaguanine synthase QueE [Pseudomonadota bacterium]HBF08857.1 7-carboxy-7-deazaguanine synthase QueE [Gammaproteobacteria bacterium]HCK91918.1 7-carboxy-7-deazaguanine synthase QueE [Gammaproteobacteria bacterium]|tara:strand:- start:1416 stop:2057 length:642 start_codon:yes stop_codon:yes gene_type:complete
MSRLKIKERFYSLQGETSLTGLPTYFIRLTGCPLRCTYCDSEYAFTGGEWEQVEDLIKDAKEQSSGLVCVTGGEPLAQPACLELLEGLCNAGLTVSLETSGAYPVAGVDPRVIKIIDFKTPGSGEMHRNKWENLDFLQPHDEVKFVLKDRADYDWARLQLESIQPICSTPILFSPVYGELDPRDLADWIVKDKLNVRMQIQLHKILWGDIPGV